MTKYFCDMCKKPILKGIDYVSVTIYEETVHNVHNTVNRYDFCTDCMREIKEKTHETILRRNSIKRGDQSE